jgi:Tol biopolymer transport system component
MLQLFNEEACKFALALSAVFLLHIDSSSAFVDPSIQWKILESTHFSIIYDSRHQALAKAYARFAEQAFAADTQEFPEHPERTVVILDDATDSANGSATSVPYPLIDAYPVLPGSMDSIADYGNWGLELMTHEYTHILTFEPANGVFKPLRWVFGSIIRPDMLLPRWYLEGIAVEMETRYSRYGRLRSANYLSIPRSIVEENGKLNDDLGFANDVTIPEWPGGARPYLTGAMMWHEMINKYGSSKIIGLLNERYSKRFPWIIEEPVRDLLDRNYREILEDTNIKAEKKAKEQIQIVQKAGTLREELLDQEGFFNHSPIVSPDQNKMLYIAHTDNKDSILELLDRSTAPQSSFTQIKSQRLDDGSAIQRASWFPDSQRFVYDKIDSFGHYYRFSDLYVYNLAEKKEKQLTHGLRVREPVISADGKHILFAQNTPGGTQLAWTDENGENYQLLYQPALQVRLSHPEFLSDHEVIFTIKGDETLESLQVFDLQTHTMKPVLAQFSPAHFPHLTPQGLVFVSDRTGAANLYLAKWDLSDARAMSNTTTRLMAGEIDPRTQELFYSKLTADGPKIFVSPKESWSKAPSPPKVASIVDADWPEYKTPDLQVDAEEINYSSWSYLYPHYWMPFAWVLPGGAYFAASTSVSDPLEKQVYDLSVQYDTLSNRPSEYADYMNTTTRFPIQLIGEDLNEYLYGTGNIVRHTTLGMAQASSYLPSLSNKWHAGVGWEYLQTDLLGTVDVRNGPQVFLKYKDVKQQGLEIAPERGGAFSILHTRFLPNVGNIDYEETDVVGSVYFSKWLPKHHTIAAYLNVAYAPRLHNALLGQTTTSTSYGATILQTPFIMRGYAPSTFIGPTIYNGSVEYHFPVSYRYHDFGTNPVFWQRTHAALFTDVTTLDGYYYSFNNGYYRPTKSSRFFVDSGVQFAFDLTLFYQAQVQLIAGAAYGFDAEASYGGIVPFLGFGL